MKKLIYLIIITLTAGCTSQKKLAYLNDLPSNAEIYPMDIPQYRIQTRDVLYISLKAMNPEGVITDYLSTANSGNNISSIQNNGGYLFGYNVDLEGKIIVPVLGPIEVVGKTIFEVRKFLQTEFDKSFKGAFVECKLLSYRYTVLGEVRTPGTFVNYSNYLTIFDALGNAGGINDYGRHNDLLVLRQTENGTRTFRVNLQEKEILTNPDYFVLPGDVIIIEPERRKIFNLNFPAVSAVLALATSALSTTLLLVNYFGR